MAVFDCLTYNGEKDILDLHLNILNNFVDKFIIVEAKTTFSGNKKPLYFCQHERDFKEFWKKINYHIINEHYSGTEIDLAENSPNTKGARHWINEFLQKESIHKALKENNVKDDDIVYIGDVDEIWTPYYSGYPAKLKLLVYAYYLNNLSNEQFWGTLVARYGDIKDKCLNHVRSDIAIRTRDIHGWHFTSMGGVKEVQRKLNDSYTSESYNTYHVQKELPERIKDGIDYLGRDFTFTTDARLWPQYLKEHRLKYMHLLKS